MSESDEPSPLPSWPISSLDDLNRPGYTLDLTNSAVIVYGYADANTRRQVRRMCDRGELDVIRIGGQRVRRVIGASLYRLLTGVEDVSTVDESEDQRNGPVGVVGDQPGDRRRARR